MATATVKLRASKETCMHCLTTVELYAKLSGLDNWRIARQCFCSHILNEIPWPFNEEPTLAAVKPGEFKEHGILLHESINNI